jgi:small subunit ribosomal protein S18
LLNEDIENNEERPRGARGQRPHGGERYIPRRKVCTFCVDKVDVIDYKRPDVLRRFLSDRGKHQRRLAVAIKRARHLALLPYAAEHLRHSS